MPDIESLCEILHEAYEAAAASSGWDTNPASRKPWKAVPEANQAATKAAVQAILDALDLDGITDRVEQALRGLDSISSVEPCAACLRLGVALYSADDDIKVDRAIDVLYDVLDELRKK